MAIRLLHNQRYRIDGTLDEYTDRWEAEEALRLIKILCRAKRQGRRIRGKPPRDPRKFRSSKCRD